MAIFKWKNNEEVNAFFEANWHHRWARRLHKKLRKGQIKMEKNLWQNIHVQHRLWCPFLHDPSTTCTCDAEITIKRGTRIMQN